MSSVAFALSDATIEGGIQKRMNRDPTHSQGRPREHGAAREALFRFANHCSSHQADYSKKVLRHKTADQDGKEG
jgi:hypothetical protein